jgi:hypothetical protein
MGPCAPISSASQRNRPVEIAAQLPLAVRPGLRVEGEISDHPFSGAFIPSSQGHHLLLGSARLQAMGPKNQIRRFC